VDDSLLKTLASIAPTYAVRGNNDSALVTALAEVRLLDLSRVKIAMIHDSGPKSGRAARLHRRFGDADLIVFGHSHVPVDEVGVGGQRLFNPGSPTERRAQPHRTVGVLELSGGRIADHRIVPVGP
jgi:putative phosphoesterase